MAEIETKNDGLGAAVTQFVKVMVGFDRPLFTALAFAISIMSAFYAFEAGRELAQDVYWKQRIEGFIEQMPLQGIRVPQDILDHIKKEHDR